MTILEEKITTGNVLLEAKEYKKAIQAYQEAIKESTIVEQKIDIYNTLGRIELTLGNNAKAINNFIESLKLHQELPEEKAIPLKINRATILNNLGLITIKTNPKEAMKYHKEALIIFKEAFEENKNNFAIHLANTHYSYGDAAYAKGDYYMAKKQYKDAVTLYDTLKKNHNVEPFIANAYYNLGNVYTDENNVYDARTNYLRALKIFRKLAEKEPEAFRSLVAATFNNLAVTAKTMYKYSDAITYYENALKEYETLIELDRETFLPFYAATLNSIGIVYTEQHEVKDDYDSFGLTGFSGFGTLSTDNSIDNKEKKEEIEKLRKQKALTYYAKAIEIYSELVVNHPELYSHYLATCHHNLGVLYDTKSDYKKAEESFEKALKIRRDLAKQQPEFFNLDVCVTLFNIVTMYQNLLEQTVNIGFKDISLKILEEITVRLESYKEDKRPILESMRSDLTYFKNYFKRINEEYLDVFDAIVKENAVIEKINETFDPSEKLKMQKHVVNLYYTLLQKHPNNPRLKEVLLNAYIKYSWFALRSNELSIAEKAIENGFKMDKNSLNLKANEGHLYLLKGDISKFRAIYKSIKNEINSENNSYDKIIKHDLEILKRDGLLSKYKISELITG